MTTMKTNLKTRLVVALFLLVIATAANAKTIYVDADRPPGGGGTNWTDAYKYLQDALAAASSGSEIWVASGIYKPDANTNEPNGSGLRTATFQLMSGVVLKGGYAGYGELDPDARNVGWYQTILSGDLSGDDPNDLSPQDLWGHPNRAENSYHLIVGSGTDQTAIIDGFTITGGNANRFEDVNDSGAGMYNDSGSPTVINCTFTHNSAGNDGLGGGGGMFNYQSDPTLVNCIFINNAADYDCSGGGILNDYSDPVLQNCTFSRNVAEYCGGAMWNIWSNPTLTNCTFTENFAWDRGGAIHNDYGSFQPVLTGCTFSGNITDFDGGAIYNEVCDSIRLTNCVFNMNSAGRHGGGIYNDHANSTLTNCLFTGNLASTGGGVYIRGYHPTNTMTLTNCTFSGNSASNGNAIACDLCVQPYPIDLLITNCILWDDGGEIWNNDGSTTTITYSDVQGGQAAIYDPCEAVIWGQGNIDADPCFVEPGRWADANDPNIIVEPNDPNAVWIDGDYHLKSEGWRWDTEFNPPRWGYNYVTSRCIDAGNPGSALCEEPISVPEDPNNVWGQNLRINMGAYGGTVEASMPPYDWALLADITNDGTVDFVDYAHLAAIYTNEDDELPADFDRDGHVDLADLCLLAEDWLKQTSWY